MNVYPPSKSVQICATPLFPLSKTGVVISALNPGLCNRNARGCIKPEIAVLRPSLGRTPEQGGRTLLHAAVAGRSHRKCESDCEMEE